MFQAHQSSLLSNQHALKPHKLFRDQKWPPPTLTRSSDETGKDWGKGQVQATLSTVSNVRCTYLPCKLSEAHGFFVGLEVDSSDGSQ